MERFRFAGQAVWMDVADETMAGRARQRAGSGAAVNAVRRFMAVPVPVAGQIAIIALSDMAGIAICACMAAVAPLFVAVRIVWTVCESVRGTQLRQFKE